MDDIDSSSGQDSGRDRGGYSYASDIFWPFRRLESVYEFISRTQAASLTITFAGLALRFAGFSPRIAAALGAFGLSSALLEVAMRALLNRESWKTAIRKRDKIGAILIQIVSGAILFLLITPGAANAPITSSQQYLIGLIVAFVSGSVFMLTYSELDRGGSSIRWKTVVPMFVSIGFIMTLFVLAPVIAKAVGADGVLHLIDSTATSNATIMDYL